MEADVAVGEPDVVVGRVVDQVVVEGAEEDPLVDVRSTAAPPGGEMVRPCPVGGDLAP